MTSQTNDLLSSSPREHFAGTGRQLDAARILPELRAMHPQHVADLFNYAAAIVAGIAKLDGPFVDARNVFAVITAREMSASIQENPAANDLRRMARERIASGQPINLQTY